MNKKVELIKKEIQLTINSCDKLINEALKNDKCADYYVGYRSGLEILLKKINGEEEFVED